MDPALTKTGISDKVKLLLTSTIPCINSPVDQHIKSPYVCTCMHTVTHTDISVVRSTSGSQMDLVDSCVALSIGATIGLTII